MKKHPAKFFCLLLLMALSLPLHAERVLAELEYFYAPDGTLTGKAFNGRRVNFEYDLRGQLLAVTDAQGNDLERYTYDPAGNRLSKTVGGVTTTYTYDEANQLISSTVNGVTTHYKYDAAGRLVQAGDKSYLYNGRNKVVEVRRNGGTVARFEYNIDGQISKAIYGTKVEEFIWDGLALVWRSGITYVNEPYITGGNPVLAGDDVLFNDMLGSTLAINGDPVEMTSFGETGNPDAFFTGKPMVDELGYAFLFRDYNPAQGKWTTSDPLGYPDGWNNLAYVNNIITSIIDRFGTDIYHVLASGAVYDLGGIPIVGHSAAIVGNSIFGYRIINHGGTNTDPEKIHSWGNIYSSVADALAALQAGRSGNDLFDSIQKWETSPAQDDIAYGKMLEGAAQNYSWEYNNCWKVIRDGIREAFYPLGELYCSDGYLLLPPISIPIPNVAYLENYLNPFGPKSLNFNRVIQGLEE